jgi:hypothetical protein
MYNLQEILVYYIRQYNYIYNYTLMQGVFLSTDYMLVWKELNYKR